MRPRPKFRTSAWLAGSLFALLLTNLILTVVISGTDLLLGQPPQFMVPLFAFLVSVAAFITVHKWNAQPSVSTVQTATTNARGSGDRSKTLIQQPAFLSMTVIRRSVAHESPFAAEERTETIQ